MEVIKTQKRLKWLKGKRSRQATCRSCESVIKLTAADEQSVFFHYDRDDDLCYYIFTCIACGSEVKFI